MIVANFMEQVVNRDFDMGKVTIALAVLLFIGFIVYISIPFDQDKIFPKLVGCFSSVESRNSPLFEIESGIVKFDDKIVKVAAGQDKGGYYIIPQHSIYIEDNGNFSVNSQGILKLRFGPESKYLEIPKTDGGVLRFDRTPCA